MIQEQIKHPVLSARLHRIRGRIYRIVSRLDVEMLKSLEPIPFAQLSGQSFTKVTGVVNWGRKLSCAWFRLRGSVPQGINHPVLLIHNTGEGLVYSPSGEILDGLTAVWTPLELPRSGGRCVVFELPEGTNGEIDYFTDWGYNGFLLNDVGHGRFAGAWLAERDDETFTLYYDYLTLALLYESTENTRKRAELSRVLSVAYRVFSHGDTAGARAALSGVLAMPSQSDFVFDAVGHGHLDLAWLWPMRESRRKAARTYAIALRNMERYPDYIYGTSQPQQLQWIKDEHPALYARIKAAILAGRIELQGGFWTECDSNLSGGESLVRQAIYGAKFAREEFGQEIRLCWLPDAFGFNGNLPQILRLCGMDYFSTIKLAWNKVNVFPYRSFEWQGVDGTRVLAHMPPEGDYNSAAGAHNLLGAIRKYPERKLNTGLLVYGSGDGGGGPRESHLELLKREQSLGGLPRVRNSSAIRFFDALRQQPIEHIHAGELYLETHQGTLTTQAANKRDNRLMERLLHNTEAVAAAFAPVDEYPMALLDEVWKETLTYQFHDILPGTCIERVYRETAPAYARMKQRMADYAESRLPVGDKPAAVNMTSFARDEHVQLEGEWYRARVAPYAIAALEPVSVEQTLSFTQSTMENGLVCLAFNEFGEIVSYKTAEGRELVAGLLNRLTLYQDPLMIPFNAWDINPNYTKLPARRLRARTVSTRIEGPRIVREQTYCFGKSKINQRVVLEAGSDCVRFETRVDWHERLRMLRADFDPADYGDEADFEIQFGAISRATTERNSIESAQFEVCGHKWASVHQNGRGFALLNDSKYGHRVKNGRMSLNLLRAPVYPNKTADRGEHTFTYAVCPLGADNARAVEEAYRLNYPLLIGRYRETASVASVSNSAVVLETIKRSEDGTAIVLRLFESLGKDAQTALFTRFVYENAVLCDLLERPLGEANLASLRFHPYQIVSIRLEGGMLQ
ncbi:MAG: glycoside hydrolase family 38 C-terminal domain-containing protein [Christensenella sp.]|nr:glycoside hydrolase family 38 C-terminal domain-containing protein [Christensenella sp.]